MICNDRLYKGRGYKCAYLPPLPLFFSTSNIYVSTHPNGQSKLCSFLFLFTLLLSYKCSHFIPLSLTVHSVKIREQSFRRQSRMILSLILFYNHLNIYTHLCTHILVLEHSHKPEYKLSGLTSKKLLERHLKEKFHNFYNMS